MVHFDELCLFVMLVGLEFDSVSRCNRGGCAACLSKYSDSVFLPPNSL